MTNSEKIFRRFISKIMETESTYMLMAIIEEAQERYNKNQLDKDDYEVIIDIARKKKKNIENDSLK